MKIMGFLDNNKKKILFILHRKTFDFSTSTFINRMNE